MSLPTLIQTRIFDVADWEVDAEFGVFPQGARAKDAVFAPLVNADPAIVAGKRYLFKRSKRSYPDQFWGEIIAYRIGCLMGLQVPPAFAAINTRTGQSAALIEWFYLDGAELFALGGDFMQALRPDFDRGRGTLHNLKDVERLMKALTASGALLQNWRQWWAEALLFDALIGNTDRHQDNWGLLFEQAEEEQLDFPTCRLAPLFDNGTSLGHERFPDRVDGWSAAQIQQYILRGLHHVKSSLEEGFVQGHLALIRHVVDDWRKYLDIEAMRERLNFSSAEIQSAIEDLGLLDVPTQLSAARMRFVIRLLVRRHALLKELLDGLATSPG